MHEKDLLLLAQAIAPILARHIKEGVEPLAARFAELEKRVGGELPALIDLRKELEKGLASAVEGLPNQIEHFVDAAISGEAAKVCQIARTEIVAYDKDTGVMPTELVSSTIAREVSRQLEAAPRPKDGNPGRDADPAVVARLVDEAVAKMPKPENGKSVTIEELRPLVDEIVGEHVKDLPAPAAGRDAPTAKDLEPVIAAQVGLYLELHPPEDGKDADPEVMKTAIDEAVAALPKAQDGTSVTPEELQPVIDAAVTRAVEALPKAKDGEDGKSVSIEDVRPIVDQAVDTAVKALPAPEKGDPGKDYDPDVLATAVREAVAAIPVPKDGMSITVEDMAPAIEKAVSEAIAKMPVPKDGVGIAGAVIDRDGNLVVTLTDGKQVPLGRVIGKDGDPGLAFEDMTEETADDGRTVIRRYSRGEQVKEFRHTFAVVLDRGVFKDGTEYVKGDGVTSGGSFWIAQKETKERPGTSDAWRLAVKKGRDGKDSQAPAGPATVKLR